MTSAFFKIDYLGYLTCPVHELIVVNQDRNTLSRLATVGSVLVPLLPLSVDYPQGTRKKPPEPNRCLYTLVILGIDPQLPTLIIPQESHNV